MKFRSIIVTCIIAVGLATQTQAASTSLEIQFLGLDLVYDGFNIYDATDLNGGNGDPNEADPLTSMDFLVDGASMGTLTTDIWADVQIPVEEIPADGGVATTSNGDDFGFDLLTSVDGWGLALQLDEFDVFYTGGEIVVSGGGLASSIFTQDLPFGLEISEIDKVTVAFSSANLGDVTDDGDFLTGFTASGTGNVKGVLVPEPASAAMVLLAAMGLVCTGRQRR